MMPEFSIRRLAMLLFAGLALLYVISIFPIPEVSVIYEQY